MIREDIYDEGRVPSVWNDSATATELTPTHTRMFVVEDDAFYAMMMQRLAHSYGIQVDIFHPDTDFYNLPMDGDYDAAIVDCNLGNLNGLQIAALYTTTPVLLMSAKDNMQMDGPWPRSIHGFCAKHRGFSEILEKSLAMANLPSLYERAGVTDQ